MKQKRNSTSNGRNWIWNGNTLTVNSYNLNDILKTLSQTSVKFPPSLKNCWLLLHVHLSDGLSSPPHRGMESISRVRSRNIFLPRCWRSDMFFMLGMVGSSISALDPIFVLTIRLVGMRNAPRNSLKKCELSLPLVLPSPPWKILRTESTILTSIHPSHIAV